MFMFVVVRMPPKGGFDRNYRILASFEWIAVVSILTAVWSCIRLWRRDADIGDMEDRCKNEERESIGGKCIMIKEVE